MPGKTGVNTVIRSNGRVEMIPGCAEIEVHADDVVQIETPGGGGFGWGEE